VNWESKYKKIAELEQQNYFIIINIHWGSEYKIKNNARQKLLAEKFIED
jgi:poly-gamma-glutamate capsule biosynthesis protein CapA/YwtB (metallophosphatase superfamily)